MKESVVTDQLLRKLELTGFPDDSDRNCVRSLATDSIGKHDLVVRSFVEKSFKIRIAYSFHVNGLLALFLDAQ
jgi:hypothetical protein